MFLVLWNSYIPACDNLIFYTLKIVDLDSLIYDINILYKIQTLTATSHRQHNA